MIFWHFGWKMWNMCTNQSETANHLFPKPGLLRSKSPNPVIVPCLFGTTPPNIEHNKIIQHGCVCNHCPYSIEKRPYLQVPGDTWTLAMACLLCAADLHVPWWIRPRRATHAVYGKGRCDIDRVVQSLCWVDPHEIMNTDCLTLIILIWYPSLCDQWLCRGLNTKYWDHLGPPNSPTEPPEATWLPKLGRGVS